MIKGIDSIILFSENAAGLANFYKEKLGLKISLEGEMGDDGSKVFSFDVGGNQNFNISDHSELKGPNVDPKRIMINFEVEGDIESQIEKLQTEGVKLIGTLHHLESYGKIQTCEDPDGNYFQLVQVRVA
jgi:predicted enzyme related to lactoylglutathione lyase